MAEPKIQRRLFDVVRAGYGNVAVTQHFLRGSEPVASVDLRAVFLSQSVQRRLGLHAVRTQPRDQTLDVSIAAIVIVKRGGVRLAAGLDDELATASRVIAAKDLQRFRVDHHVALRVVRLRPEVLSRFDADHALVEAKRAPRQLVDLVAPKSRHRREQEDFELLRVIGSEFVARALDQARHVERGAVARDSDLLDLDARERQRLRQFDEFAHP